MKLEYLKLTNFRGFREFEITFDPQFTVLLGGNMAGKTAVLDAAAFVLRRLLGDEQARDIADDDVHQAVVSSGGIPLLQPQFPVTIEAKLADDDFHRGSVVWHFHRNEALGTFLDSARLTPRESSYTLLNLPITNDLPVVAYCGVHRNWARSQTAEDLRGIGNRYDGYVGAFDVQSAHAMMAGWIRKQTYVELQQGKAYVQPQLAAVEAAVRSCIEGLKRFWFDVQSDDLRLELDSGEIRPFHMLSEGYRNMVALVADVAWRASVLNPHHGPNAHQLTEGIVLIDELDLHLHPAWQRSIVGDLRRTFPKIQFIVTTHSPQIVASVHRDQVRLLDRNQLVSDKPYVEGRDASEILEDVFGVAARPEAVKAEIDELFRLIEDEDFEAARRQLAALEERLGPHDAEMVRARWILDSEELQASRQPAAAP
jgi:predicted ATP-binding protein involved in virulence